MSPDKIFITVNGRRISLAKLIENPKAATDVWVYNCPGLAALPDLPAATDVRVENCAGLTALPDLPAATVVRVHNCPGLAALPEFIEGGMDSRNFHFFGIKLRGQWRVCAGCRNLSLVEACRHWSDRPDCLGLVKKIAGLIEASEDQRVFPLPAAEQRADSSTERQPQTEHESSKA